MKYKIYALALAATMLAGNANAEMLDNGELSLDPAEQTEQIESMIEIVFEPMEKKVPGIIKKMTKIADCESYGGNDGLIMHIKSDGALARNSKSTATGAFQVLLGYHRKTYSKLGLDPRQVEDNLLFARFLVEGRISRGQWAYADWECA